MTVSNGVPSRRTLSAGARRWVGGAALSAASGHELQGADNKKAGHEARPSAARSAASNASQPNYDMRAT
jgi:hypothetical protein